jgi:outer membrane receptor protein involved in Fe transport
MTLDQDFSPKSMFTMQQMQREHTLTEEIVIRNADKGQRWQWLSGAFIFGKWLDMSSPVTFKKDGIDGLILNNINNGLHTVFPDNNMTFGTDSFVIASNFRIPTIGAALYHQSDIRLGRWNITAGIRFDYEQTSMRYNSNATVPYRFDLTMTEYKELYTEFKGREKQHFFEILPKIAVEYNMQIGNVYATITRGYKSGGFNTQIFSDILQVQMMNNMMNALGVELDSAVGTTTYDSASATKYKPETSWNFEIGSHITPLAALHLDASLFWIECFDQQVTVLPKGNNTGRMMSNAARARSYGIELSADYTYKGLNIRADYGYTNARFREYDDGLANYAGNYLPYAPQNTAAVMASYTWGIHNKHLQYITLSADWRGIGNIYWDESNRLYQDFYSLLGAQVMLRMQRCSLTLWGRNLTNTSYNVFYFKSVGEEFFSKGTPMQLGVRISVNI